MRQRQLLPSGDFSFGSGLPFLANSPLCVAQAVLTRLQLNTGEWFLDSSEGTPLKEQILGFNTETSRDLAVRTRVLNTIGVQSIDEYVSVLDATRKFTVLMIVQTIYGQVAIGATLNN